MPHCVSNEMLDTLIDVTAQPTDAETGRLTLGTVWAKEAHAALRELRRLRRELRTGKLMKAHTCYPAVTR